MEKSRERCRDGFTESKDHASERRWRRDRFKLLIKKTRDIRQELKTVRERCGLDVNVIGKFGHVSHHPRRWTNHLPLLDYKHMKWLPEIVNVVSLCDLVAIGDTQLPLNLYHIAKFCNSTFYAPGKFAAVQLGIDNPKSRILIFHTGRIVQTGTTSIMAAHNAISLTLKILRDKAGLYLRATNFSIINIVGAVSLNTVFNCSAFADQHTDEVRFDPGNFVGLTWKPVKLGVPIIVEVYSTGRANIPGATREHILYKSFAKLVPELIRYSSASAKAPTQPVDDADDAQTDETADVGFDLDSLLLQTRGGLGNVSMRF